eukprot:gene50630-68871_t
MTDLLGNPGAGDYLFAGPRPEGYNEVHRNRTCDARSSSIQDMRAYGGIPVQETGLRNGAFGADKFGLTNLKAVNWNFGAPQLYEHALRNGEAVLSADGALCADTGDFTGRSPKDKYTVKDASTENMWWAGNQALTPEQ